MAELHIRRHKPLRVYLASLTLVGTVTLPFFVGSPAFAQRPQGDMPVPRLLDLLHQVAESGTLPLPPIGPGTPSSTSTPTSPASSPEEPTPAGSGTPTPPVTVGDSTRFTCQFYNGQYTVMYHPASQPDQAYPWATPTALGGGWSPERRCNEISRRLEFYRPDGLLELRTAVENNYDTVCVTTQQNPTCRIVLTVPPGQNPEMTRDRVFQNLVVADSGQSTQAVTTFVEGQETNGLINQIGNLLNIHLPRTSGNSGARPRENIRTATGDINLRPFLDRQDGGTGSYLQGGIRLNASPAQTGSGSQLNPNNFR
ncbi:COP23 domain-containing protein [Trichothermofontia sichuanensis B231]|uniref:COP23 domain-containing protein n=1 Tax=Trichothermofontia sichuanensis TaxID=3045816 RepID=UPI002245BA62|nr:COP23 domain-containing protein [Trichothermofontia sichuanensis]UZQ53133.1 COP23 domain-containing protein [Trichothermofontia sichuanensis B231]